ncbi:hypothetical protein BKA57DRAFT_498929 [Linnemannia elongata]|nr:hypothetical protein BKA57DRAFT_498929 [Linnemannia elongata]
MGGLVSGRSKLNDGTAAGELAMNLHIKYHPLSSNLTHLDLYAGMSAESINHFASILLELSLVHFGTGRFVKDLLKHVNIASLKSLSIPFEHKDDLQTVIDCLLPRKEGYQIDSLMLRSELSEKVPARRPL